MQTNEALKDNYYVLNEQMKKMQDQIVGLEKRDNEVYRTIFEANPIPDSARAKNHCQGTGISTGSGNGSGKPGRIYCQFADRPQCKDSCTD